jgi:hypothetical protein
MGVSGDPAGLAAAVAQAESPADIDECEITNLGFIGCD